jgi:hypothetical protein
MDSVNFLAALAGALGDASNQIYSSAALQQAMTRAVVAYSQFRPAMRRMGTGNLASAVVSGATQLTVAGGPFQVGDTLTVDPWTSVAETAVVAGAARDMPEDGATATTALTQITLVSALGAAHAENAVVTKQTPGLLLVAGQDTYPLPYDFRSPDHGSFDAATGQKLFYHAGNSFYDASLRLSGELSGAFFGESTNFGPSGSEWPASNALCEGSRVGRPVRYRFLLGDAPQLVVSPAPCGPMTLDFYYFGCHTIDSAPSVDVEALLQYSIYAALSSRIGSLSGLIDLRMADGEESQPSKMTAGLKEAAAAALAEFDRLTRLRPFAVGG